MHVAAASSSPRVAGSSSTQRERPSSMEITRVQGGSVGPSTDDIIAPHVKSVDEMPVREPGKTSIIFLCGGVGLGHKGPGDATVSRMVTHKDFETQHQLHYYRNIPVGSFIFKGRDWKDNALYQVSANFRLAAKFATKWRSIFTQRQTYKTVANILKDPTQYDLVISNHRILTAAASAAMPIAKRLHVEYTDHGVPHLGWPRIKRFNNPASQDYFISPNETVTNFLAGVIPKDRMVTIPYGVRKEFEEVASRDRSEVRRELGLPMDKRLVVLSAGGGGQAAEYPVKVIEGLLGHENGKDLHIVVVTGNNKDFAAHLEQLKTLMKWDNLQIEGFCPPKKMAELQYAAGLSDPPSMPLVQSGGGSIGENAALGNAACVYQAKSGIEHPNKDYFVAENLGFVALTVDEVVRTVHNTTAEQIEEKKQNVAKLGIVGGAQMRAEFHLQKATEAHDARLKRFAEQRRRTDSSYASTRELLRSV